MLIQGLLHCITMEKENSLSRNKKPRESDTHVQVFLNINDPIMGFYNYSNFNFLITCMLLQTCTILLLNPEWTKHLVQRNT